MGHLNGSSPFWVTHCVQTECRQARSFGSVNALAHTGHEKRLVSRLAEEPDVRPANGRPDIVESPVQDK